MGLALLCQFRRGIASGKGKTDVSCAALSKASTTEDVSGVGSCSIQYVAAQSWMRSAGGRRAALKCQLRACCASVNCRSKLELCEGQDC